MPADAATIPDVAAPHPIDLLPSQGAVLHGENLAALWRSANPNHRAACLEVFKGQTSIYGMTMLLATAVELSDRERDELLQCLCSTLDQEEVSS